ncbi:MAG: hypothetical protein GX901_05640 [Lentisphaerae bacterium]|nr:hypothetical protein [Lentisphaerota bacterium]
MAYYHYILHNTGNTPDTFALTTAFEVAAGNIIAPDKVEVYYDANNNGLVDAGDVLLATDGGNEVSTALLAQDAIIPLIVAVHSPSNAVEGNLINVDLDAQSAGDPAETDEYSNWNQTSFSLGTGILTAMKGADVSSAIPGQTLTYTVEGSNTGSAPIYGIKYPTTGTDEHISFDPSGGDTERNGLLIVDALDSEKLEVGAKYAGIENVVISGPSRAQFLYWNEASNTYHLYPANAAWTSTPKVALFIPDDSSLVTNSAGTTDPAGVVLTPGQGYKFSFTIEVVTPYPVGADKLIGNKVEATYAKNAAGDEVETESNYSLVRIEEDPLHSTAGAAIGPWNVPMADDQTDYAITHPQVDAKGLSVEGTSEPDKTTAGIRDAGEVISFPVTILNPNEALPSGDKLGAGGPATAADVYNISYVNPDPSQFSVVLYKGDGTTPLADSNGDGKPDTGSLNPEQTATIIVKVYIKADAEDVNANEFTVTATSSNNPGISDDTFLIIASVRPAGVDIATSGELAGDDNATAADASEEDDDDATTSAGVLPGAIVSFPVHVANLRPIDQTVGLTADETTTAADTYKLSYEKLTGAEGFTVVLLKDGDRDGEVDPDELQPVSDTGWLPAVANLSSISDAEIFFMNVRVSVPKGTPEDDYFVKVTATSTNNPGVSDSMHILVRVLNAPSIEVTPDNTATVVAGGTYIFSHVVTNTGNVGDTVTLSHSALPNGYNAVWVDCDDGSVTGQNNPSTVTTGFIPAGETANVCLRVFVPANAASGSVLPITVTADMDSWDVGVYPETVDTALDIITVIDGALQLTKSNDPTSAVAPGKTIKYTTVYKNLSPGELTNSVIADAIPAHTILAGTAADISATLPDGTPIKADANAASFEWSNDKGATWDNFNSAPAFREITNIRVKIGDVPAGEGGELVFTVEVK